MDHTEKLGMRYFSAEDRDMRHITDGLYQYGITLEIVDGNIVWMQEKIKEISSFIVELKKYESSLQIPSNFNFKTRHLSESYKRSLKKKYDKKPLTSPWNKATMIFFDILENFSNKSIDEVKLIKTFNLFLNPITANIETVGMAVKILEQLLGQLESVSMQYGVVSLGKTPLGSSGKIKSSSRRPITISIKEFGRESYDSNIPKENGASFILDNKEMIKKSLLGGTITLSGQEFKNRIKLETEKYFTSREPNLTNNLSVKTTEMSFLAPAMISAGREQINLIDKSASLLDGNKFSSLMNNLKAPEKGDTLQSALALQNSSILIDAPVQKRDNPLKTNTIIKGGIGTANHSEAEPHTPSEPRDDFQLLKNKIISKEIDTENNKDLFSARIFDINKKNNIFDLFDRKIEMSETLNTSKDTVKQELTLSGDSRNKNTFEFFKTNEKNIPLGTQIGVENITAKSGIEKLSQAPNQIKSLAISNVSPTAINFKWDLGPIDAAKSPNNLLSFFYNYKFLAKVEYLFGYEKSIDDKRQIKSPIWRKMTEEAYDLNIGKRLFCRNERYEDSDLEILKEKTLEVEIYHKFFFLIPEGPVLNTGQAPPIEDLLEIDVSGESDAASVSSLTNVPEISALGRFK
jgi:hypothetical protein